MSSFVKLLFSGLMNKERGEVEKEKTVVTMVNKKNDKRQEQEEEKDQTMDTMVKKKKDKREDLVDLVFSWSIADIMNENIFRDKVDRIPNTFSSAGHYLNSFVYPLVEETHADLRSNFMTVNRAPVCEVYDVRRRLGFDYPNNLVYKMLFKPGSYEPEFGDLIAFTELKPKCIDDLNRPKRQYHIALVEGKDEDIGFIKIISSKPVEFENKYTEEGKQRDIVFAVYLTNLTTNMRIWKALHPNLNGANVKMINSVLRFDSSLAGDCDLCSSNKVQSFNMLDPKKVINPIGLESSQEYAVLNCIATMNCNHLNSVKLIWGPPGTGKTKTISSLLLCLFRMKCRTLTCAPTNTAVLGVTKRLMNLLRGRLELETCRLELETYGLGDIVLFGNGERMKIDDHDDLYDVFLAHRVCMLAHCFAPSSGWKGSAQSMIGLLQDPESNYQRYRTQEIQKEKKDSDSDDSDEEGVKGNEMKSEEKKGTMDMTFLNQFIVHELKKNKKNSKNKRMSHERNKSKCGQKNNPEKDKTEPAVLMTFEEYFTKTLTKFRQQLFLCIKGLCTHMPTSYLPFEIVKDMDRVLDILEKLQSLINCFDANEGLRERLKHNKVTCGTIAQCLKVLKTLSTTFSVPDLYEDHKIRNFCLQNTCLIFCTASSSAKLHVEGMAPIQLLIIDEAAQLKECESSIPLQLPGLHHSILVGDEKQLPAMVQSKICEKANFGRSLFERLVVLGQNKHLLNVQYRMHPSISRFPNSEFYHKQIKDGRNVTERSYKRSYLLGRMFGPYSFIDVNDGKENFDDRHSLKNMVEVSVLVEILSKLNKESISSDQKVRIGCISPYKAQVSAIKERLGNMYSTDAEHKFSVNVRSVDGFQGGEEDLIIISTVRCNGNGSVGFLSNRQRANVLLTRAKFCLWILGSAATLLNSGSIWKKLVIDAKRRNCFFSAHMDKSLALSISHALLESGHLNSLFHCDSVIFRTSMWKVCFSPDFLESTKSFEKLGIQNDVVSLVVKLSNGCFPRQNDETLANMEGITFQLMKWCEVKGPLKLIWTIEVIPENGKERQIIKVWDVLPLNKIPNLAEKLNVTFGDYTLIQLNRCLCQRIDGELTLPISWPTDAKVKGSYSNLDLASRLSAISLSDNAEPSTRIR